MYILAIRPLYMGSRFTRPTRRGSEMYVVYVVMDGETMRVLIC